MKVEKAVEAAFIPVRITLESQAEVNALAAICDKIGGNCNTKARRMFSILDVQLKQLSDLDLDPIEACDSRRYMFFKEGVDN